MKVTTAIINYNASKFLERSIRFCQNQFRSDYEIEILVVDDNSIDDSSRHEPLMQGGTGFPIEKWKYCDVNTQENWERLGVLYKVSIDLLGN